MEESNFSTRRASLCQLLPETAIIVSAATHHIRSHDSEFPFHQNTHFKYLTGFREPESLLVITQKPDEGMKTHFFVRPKDDHAEMWAGKRMGIDHTKDVFGFDEVYDIAKAWELMPTLLWNHKKVAVDWSEQPLIRDQALKVMTTMASMRKRKMHRPMSLIDLAPAIGRVRLVKEANEIASMRKAAQISNLGHRAAMAMATPGKTEADVRHFMEYIFRKHGSEDNAYESIVAGGRNALTLHYVENNAVLNDKELLLIDAGSQFNGYASDITRTFPINGKYTPAQKEVYEIVLTAQKVAIGMAKPGVSISQIHSEVEKVLAKAMIDAGLITTKTQMSKESLEELLLNKEGSYAIKSYYPHGTSHWLGLDVHDMSPYLEDDLEDIKLAAGMVITVEPGLYFNKPHEQVQFKLPVDGIGIRIEDDILITDKGHDNLSANVPKEVAEVEAACKLNPLEF
ncbi:MAG: Xaa-Pro aminopeptidase [Halobacteriovorax sp.]|nr:Xaa-Pro aminopeptidase [Halobacteriovorax sp.]